MYWKYALYCGRFQPPHQGHLSSVKYGLKIAKKVLIGIRDTEINFKNPLTINERIDLWKILLKEEKIVGRVLIKTIPDFGKNVPLPNEDKVVLYGHPLLDWARNVEKIFGISPDNTVFIGNKPSMVLAFNLLGYIVYPGHRNIHRLVDVSATELRRLILNRDNRWMKMLPNSIVNYLIKINISSRLEKLK